MMMIGPNLLPQNLITNIRYKSKEKYHWKTKIFFALFRNFKYSYILYKKWQNHNTIINSNYIFTSYTYDEIIFKKCYWSENINLYLITEGLVHTTKMRFWLIDMWANHKSINNVRGILNKICIFIRLFFSHG